MKPASPAQISDEPKTCNDPRCNCAYPLICNDARSRLEPVEAPKSIEGTLTDDPFEGYKEPIEAVSTTPNKCRCWKRAGQSCDICRKVSTPLSQQEEPTTPRTAHEWLQDALGRYQVTHIHSSIREALKVMDKTENDAA